MAQSEHEIKIIPARSISRDSKSRNVLEEKRIIEPEKEETQSARVPRREMMQALVPAAVKALTEITRSLTGTIAVTAAQVQDRVKTKNSD